MTKTVANDDNILIKFSDDNDPVSPCDALTSLKFLPTSLHMRERGIKLHVNNLISELCCASAAANDISN
jgi:hypothetical protein